MDESPYLKWRIDAWDSLAGRAFLCRRFPEGADDPQLDQSAIFVSPPFFQPEPLASRAPGLAATRGTLQSGFFIDGQEVGFATLDDAIAFIRRGYNSPGSEPFPGAPITGFVGPEGRGGPGLALELPELPITPGFKELDLAITDRMKKFTSLPDMVGPEGPAERMDWNLADPKVLQHGHQLLSVAANELMLELLRRFPSGGSPENHNAWIDSAQRFGQQLIRLGLWDDVYQKCTIKLARLPFEQLARIFAISLPDGYSADEIQNSPWELLEILIFGRSVRFWRHRELGPTEKVDVYDDLALFPLPDRMSHRYHGFGNSAPTVLTLLSAWFAYPMSVKGATGLDRALLLFGGACVVVPALQRESWAYRPSMIDMNQQLRDAFVLRLGQAAWDWIAKQLPDRAFEKKLENALQKIPQIWTNAAEAGGSDPIYGETVEIYMYGTGPLRDALSENDSEASEENTAVQTLADDEEN